MTDHFLRGLLYACLTIALIGCGDNSSQPPESRVIRDFAWLPDAPSRQVTDPDLSGSLTWTLNLETDAFVVEGVDTDTPSIGVELQFGDSERHTDLDGGDLSTLDLDARPIRQGEIRHQYPGAGTYRATLEVTAIDEDGGIHIDSEKIELSFDAGPQVSGARFGPEDVVSFEAERQYAAWFSGGLVEISAEVWDDEPPDRVWAVMTRLDQHQEEIEMARTAGSISSGATYTGSWNVPPNLDTRESTQVYRAVIHARQGQEENAGQIVALIVRAPLRPGPSPFLPRSKE